MSQVLPKDYQLRVGTGRDRALLLKFMDLTYQELFPTQTDFSHLAATVGRFFSPYTPLWWVEEQPLAIPVACLWLGNAIDQVSGDRYAQIFLLYVGLQHRRRGIASALMEKAHLWAVSRGDRQIGLQVFANNLPALNLYHRLGYQTQSLTLHKSLPRE